MCIANTAFAKDHTRGSEQGPTSTYFHFSTTTEFVFQWDIFFVYVLSKHGQYSENQNRIIIKTKLYVTKINISVTRIVNYVKKFNCKLLPIPYIEMENSQLN